jgi:hypothetical protein
VLIRLIYLSVVRVFGWLVLLTWNPTGYSTLRIHEAPARSRISCAAGGGGPAVSQERVPAVCSAAGGGGGGRPTQTGGVIHGTDHGHVVAGFLARHQRLATLVERGEEVSELCQV